jgi:DNA-binding NarL/FixJ family response regulator
VNETRIVVADDSEPMLYMLRELLKADYDVVASVGDGRAAVEATERLKPELVLLDISMPIVDGFEAARQIKELRLSALIIFVSDHREKVYIEVAFSIGGSGYVIKSKMITELVPAIREVLAGREYGRPAAAAAHLRPGPPL